MKYVGQISTDVSTGDRETVYKEGGILYITTRKPLILEKYLIQEIDNCTFHS